MFRHNSIRLLFALFVVYTPSAPGEPVSPELATQVAQNWLAADSERILTETKSRPSAFQTVSPMIKPSVVAYDEISNNGVVYAFVFHLQPAGFIITTADTDFKPILAYSYENNFDSTPNTKAILTDFVLADIKNRIESMSIKQKPGRAYRNQTQWAELSSAVNAKLFKGIEQWPSSREGWIITRWYQTAHWNDFCPTLSPTPSSVRCVVGCVATATAQIVNYWKFPNQINFTNEDSYTSSGNAGEIEIPQDALSRDYPAFSELGIRLSELTYNAQADEEGYLSFGLGVKLKMQYGSESSAYNERAATVFRDIGYSAQLGPWSAHVDDVIANMKSGWPAQLAIYDSDSGHSVVVDGYRSDGMFHVNFGWSTQSATTWYNIPEFEGQTYNTTGSVVYDVNPEPAWRNDATGLRNSFSSVYGGPTEGKTKWTVDGQDGTFTGELIVGYGGNIYATYEDAELGILRVNKFGDADESVQLTEANSELHGLAQSSPTRVYTADDDGTVFEINPITQTVRALEHQIGDQALSCSVDASGDLYILTQQSLTKFDVPSSGAALPTFTAAFNSTRSLKSIEFSSPAIDDAQGLIFVIERDSSSLYLVTLGQHNLEQFERAQLPPNNVGFRGPVLDYEGNVYLVANGKMYVFRTPTFDSPWKIFGDGLTGEIGRAMRPPVVGRDGRLYATFLKGQPGNYDFYIRAFTRVDIGLTQWWSYPAVTNSPDASSPELYHAYVANNGIVYYSVKYELGNNDQAFELHALRDNGGSAQHLWMKDFSGTHIGDPNFSFGPGNTAYVVARGSSDRLTAISGGAEGDPYGAALGKTVSNTPPAQPANPIAELNATKGTGISVNLNWTNSPDPDGDTLSYDLYLGYQPKDATAQSEEPGLTGNLVKVATSLQTSQYVATGLLPGKIYHWAVVTTDGQTIQEGPIWSFETVNADHDGDANGDGMVTIADVIVIRRDLVGLDSPLLTDREAADVNNNGGLDIGDVILIRRYLVGIDDVVGG